MMRVLFSVFLITVAIAGGISLAPLILNAIGTILILAIVFPLKWMGAL